jgi:hypothetical protein
MEAACAAAVLALLVLDAHLEPEGKDNHALALLETAQWLHARLVQLLSSSGRRSSGRDVAPTSRPYALALAASDVSSSSRDAYGRIRVGLDGRGAVSGPFATAERGVGRRNGPACRESAGRGSPAATRDRTAADAATLALAR